MIPFRTALICAALAIPLPLAAETYAEMFPALSADPEYAEETASLEKLTYRMGTVTLPNGRAKLDLGQEYYYFDVEDARYVLEDLWGNYPDPTVEGMVFPRDVTPLHDGAWGMILSYEAMGHVKDEDADSYDYDDLLAEMKADTRAFNEQRVADGYGSIELIGWAEPPHYDKAEHKLYWAKELQFSDYPRTLNYDIRALGREGVLVMSVVADMDQLDVVRDATPALLAMTSFTPGNQYADFLPGVDKVAAVGIGGLIAGKVLAKTGFLAVALIFLKKFWFLVLIPLVWLKNLVFRRREG